MNSEEETRELDRFSVVTLIFFVISIVFVIKTIRIPLPLIPLPTKKNVCKRRRLRLVIPLNLATAPVLIVFILKAAQCIPWSVIRDGITGGGGLVQPFNILLFFFSLAYMAMSLDLTGILQSAAFWVSNRGGTSGRKLYFYFYLMTTCLSAVLGNDPVILSGTAFLVYFTKIAQVSHVAWIFSEFVTCNTASMLLFVGNPTNLVLCEGFSVNYLAFTAYTLFPFLACSIVGYLALWLQFNKKHIPRSVTATTVPPRSALRDPLGAVMGSIWLLVTLILITGTGFAGVSAYMISVPGAVSKALFDVIRDYLRTMETGKTEGDGVVDVEGRRQRPRESINLEDGIHLHRADSGLDEDIIPSTSTEEGYSSRSMAEPSIEKRRTERQTTFNNNDDNSNVSSGTSTSHSQTTFENPISHDQFSSPEIISLKTYLKEILHGTSLHSLFQRIVHRLPTFSATLSRLPYALLPFSFSQFILVESLSYTGWITLFSHWLVKIVSLSVPLTVLIVLLLSILLCNCSGTNIGATILLVKILKHPDYIARVGFNEKLDRAGMLSVAVGSNIGAVGFVFSASLAGLLWRGILRQKGIHVGGWEFVKWNLMPLALMTVAGGAVTLAVVTVAPT